MDNDCSQLSLFLHSFPIHFKVATARSKVWLALWCGLGGTSEQFGHLLDGAKEHGVNVLALDPPGHGLTPIWDNEMHRDVLSNIWAEIISYIELEGGTEIFIGGHSYGAYSAVFASQELQSSLTGLVLLDGGYLDPFPEYDREEASQQAMSFLNSRRFNSWEDFIDSERQEAGSWDPFIEQMLKSTMTIDSGVIVPIITLESSMQVMDVLSTYHVSLLHPSELPTLLLYATTPKELYGERAQGITQFVDVYHETTAIGVPNSGHDLLVDNPIDTTDYIWSFVTKK